MKDIFSVKIDQSPQTPGVYLLRDSEGHVVYVGKSINIRKRLLQHAASLKAGWWDRNHRKVYHVSDVSWCETNSELYALLLEDQLIKQHWPIGNVRQKEYLEYAYLAVTTDALPRIIVINARQREQYKSVYGPFRTVFYAQDMADLLKDRFRLRTCVAPSAGGCMQYDIHKCSGPCKSHAAAARYLRSVNRAISSLQSPDVFFIRFIENRMKNHAQKQEYEKAAHDHRMQNRYLAFIKRQKFIAMFRQHGLLIHEKGRWPNTFLFLKGNLFERNGKPMLIQSPANDAVHDEFHHTEWQIIDRAGVILNWMHNRRSDCAAAVLDRRYFHTSFPDRAESQVTKNRDESVLGLNWNLLTHDASGGSS
jgi:excinuclease UvrABC nuclease subunit